MAPATRAWVVAVSLALVTAVGAGCTRETPVVTRPTTTVATDVAVASTPTSPSTPDGLEATASPVPDSPTTDATGSTTTTTASTTSAAAQPTSTSGPAPAGGAKEAFLVQGNAICKTMNERSAALSTRYKSSGRTPAAAQELLDQNATLIETALGQLKALPQPPGDEAQLASIYAQVEQLVQLSRALAAAVGQGDRALVDQLQGQGKQVQQQANAASTAYGLTECGKGS